MNMTPAKIAANRKNAQKSTGPVTEEGKASSSMNAVKHGRYVTNFNRISGDIAGNLKICEPCGEDQQNKCRAKKVCLMWDHITLRYIRSHYKNDPIYHEEISIPQIATLDMIFTQQLRYAQMHMFETIKKINSTTGIEYEVPLIGIEYLKNLFDMAEKLSKTVKDMQLTKSTQDNIDVEWAKLAMEKLDPDLAMQNKEKIVESMVNFRESYSQAAKEKELDDAINDFRNRDLNADEDTDSNTLDDIGESPFGTK